MPSIYDQLAYEFVLMSRYSVQNLPAFGRASTMDRSALILLARLEASGPMSVAELADAFELNTSTVHRQVKAAEANGLIELIDDPSGAPAKLRSSPFEWCIRQRLTQR
ncbi:MarR family transcriptional regulator [Corynebacterium lubricantis]|uniref:MarR family transcriptional regulator n=1 Tax=Corynebacterium lubricantis TaxID=541095 RepID=UPI001FE200DA|nr:helix-turn-helix domain-containing protein [Corynebacterium lubricantis]